MFVDISYYKIQWFEVASEDDFHSDFCWEFAVSRTGYLVLIVNFAKPACVRDTEC